MKKNNFRAVIFELDGVIVNSVEAGLSNIETVCVINDIPFTVKERDAILKLWSNPTEVILTEGLGLELDRASLLLKQLKLLEEHRPAPLVNCVNNTMIWLRRNKIAKGLLSSRNRYPLSQLLTEKDLLEEFVEGGIAALEDTKHPKPDPKAFDKNLSDLARRGIDREECIYVGNTQIDIDAGTSAGITTLIALTGPMELTDIPASCLPIQNFLESIAKLPEWIERHHEGELLNPDLPSLI